MISSMPGWIFWRVAVGALVLVLAGCYENSPEPKSTSVLAKPTTLAPSPNAKSSAPPAGKMAESAKPGVDEELAATVKKALDATSDLKDQAIEVSASSGVVHLWGTVSNTTEKRHAERIASSIAGVRSVDNRLVIVEGS